jgi:HPt (histidine-containing phosphotransfer) domain-containing protein
MTQERPSLFNPAQLSEMLNGDTEGVQEVLIVFLESARKLTSDIASAALAGDPQLLHHLAHTLKGSAVSVGALSLQSLALELQVDAEQKHDKYFLSLAEKICTAVSALETHLRQNGMI